MSVQAALESTDESVIKTGRGHAKKEITKSVKRLEAILARKDGEDFDFAQISEIEVVQLEKKLNEDFSTFQQIHRRYCVGENEAKEEEFVDADDNYAYYEFQVTASDKGEYIVSGLHFYVSFVYLVLFAAKDIFGIGLASA